MEIDLEILDWGGEPTSGFALKPKPSSRAQGSASKNSSKPLKTPDLVQEIHMPEDTEQLIADLQRMGEENMRLRYALNRIATETHTRLYMQDIAREALKR